MIGNWLAFLFDDKSNNSDDSRNDAANFSKIYCWYKSMLIASFAQEIFPQKCIQSSDDAIHCCSIQQHSFLYVFVVHSGHVVNSSLCFLKSGSFAKRGVIATSSSGAFVLVVRCQYRGTLFQFGPQKLAILIAAVENSS